MNIFSTVFLVLTASNAALAGSEKERWDPSRSAILFSRWNGEYWQICSLDPDTGESKALTNSLGDKRFPNLSPDGATLFYVDGAGALQNMDRFGKPGETALSAYTPLSEPVLSQQNEWSFMRVRRDGAYQTEIWTADRSGQQARKITRAPLRHMESCWSTDGRKLALIEFDPREKFHALILCNADGSAPETLARGKDRLASPSCSPDGQRIVFAKEVEGNHDLWLFDRGSKQTQRLTFHPDLDFSPVFDATGDWIFYVSRSSGALDLWKIPANGGDPKRLTDGRQPCRDPFFYVPRSSATLRLGPVVLDRARRALTAEVSEPARLTLDAVDAQGRMFRLAQSEIAAKGQVSLSWPEKGDSGKPLPHGLYTLRLRAWNESGAALWDPSRTTGGELVRISGLRFDKESKKIQFDLPQPARVRVRAGLEQGPMLETVWDWRACEAGTVSIEYPGDLPDPWGNFWDRADAKTLVWAYALAENAWVVGDPAASNGIEENLPSRYANSERDLENHAKHPPYLCHDPQLTVRFAEDYPAGADGLAVVGDRVVLRVDAANARERAIAENLRFEVILYLDGQFFLEDEDSLLPFHYPLDLSRFPEGKHSILVNLINFQDHAGAAFLSFHLRREKR